MKLSLFVAALAATVTVGCTDAQIGALADAAAKAKAGASTTQPAQPGSTTPTTASPAPAATTAPGANATTTTTDAFVVGRKWVYAFNSKAAGVSTTGDVSIAVTAVTADSATVTTATNLGGVSNTTTTTVKRNSANPFAGFGGSASGGITADTAATSTTNETITVAAGTYDCVKTTYTTAADKGGALVTIWTSKTVGLVKQTSTAKPVVSVPGLPAGIDLTTTFSLELKSIT